MDKEDFSNALDTLKRGGIILYPTDTVWGLGCDATNQGAVERIFELKRRKESKSMLSLVASEAQLERFVENVPEAAWMLIEVSVDPLTIIYDRPHGLAPGLLAEDGSAGIRVTKDAFCKKLCEALRRPIVSTSANISGKPAPRFFREISDDVKEGADYIVKERRKDEKPRKASGIIKVSDDGTVKVIR